MNEFVKVGIISGINEMVKLSINTYIKPKIEYLNKKSYAEVEVKFNEYLDRSYNKHVYMDTIVFRNQQKMIDDLYIPLTVSKSDAISKKGDMPSKNDGLEILIDKYSDEFIPLYRRVLLIDNAGMGKSTIIKYLYLAAIKENKGIPILIELRRLSKDTPIIDFIVNEMNGIRGELDNKDIFDLIEGGDFIFFFDGYDEIIEESKSKIIDNLKDFISKVDKNTFVISSREENSLNCFGNFQRFDIKPLEKEEAYSLIRKYDNNGSLASELIKKLENEENLKIISEFLANPLMVSLLYKAFEYKSNVPYKKNIFYRQVYDALFEDHDKSKGGAYVHEKKSKLDIEDFCKVLRIIGFLTLKEGVIYSKEKLIEIIKKSKQLAIGIEFKENDFIRDVVYAVPLFVKEGGEYKWIHKSFQEYFAASYICIDAKEKGSMYLSQMASVDRVDKYYNVLDFCYDIDYTEFRKTIIYPIIEEFIQYYENSYTDDAYEKYDLNDLDIRKSWNFIYRESYIKRLDASLLKSQEESAGTAVDTFKEVFKDWEFFQESKSSVSINSRGACMGVLSDYNGLTLLRLLNSKQSSIIKEYRVVGTDDSAKRFVSEIPNGEYSINDNPENPLNNKHVFSVANDYVMCRAHRLNRNKILLDYNQCIKMKNEIEEQIRFEKEEKFFL